MNSVWEREFCVIAAFLVGACVGSFLNVVIYRVPLGMSVNKPNRSFCPVCKKPIPMWLNLPLVSWLWLRGRCKECGAKISFRYFFVELLTALLFAVAWWLFPPVAAGFLCVLAALLVAISFIDTEHLVIPEGLTWIGVAFGLVGCALFPALPMMAGKAGNWLDGLKHGGIGWGVGFFGLWGVVELGKLAFGKKKAQFEKPVAWSLKEPEGEEEPLKFVLDGEEIAWWDLFFRKTDRLELECDEIQLDGASIGKGKLAITELEIRLPDGKVRKIEEIKSLSGTAISALIPREAMGMGDVYLMGMIGAFFGWMGVVFSLFVASLYALVAALIGRIGFGKPLPFGPFLAMAALTWAFGGWKLWVWYFHFLWPDIPH